MCVGEYTVSLHVRMHNAELQSCTVDSGCFPDTQETEQTHPVVKQVHTEFYIIFMNLMHMAN